MRIDLACGGTGGHVFPGVATAEALRARGHQVRLWMAGKDVESTAARDWPGEAITVPAEGFGGGGPWRSLRAAWTLARAAGACTARMRVDRPDVVLAMGSYASIGPAYAARRLGCPLVLHEANVVPGRAVRLLARRAAAVAATFEESRFHLRRRELAVTGMPLRPALVAALGEAPRPRAADAPFTVLVVGGSRGARRLNEVVLAAARSLVRRDSAVRIVHLAGADHAEAVRAGYASAGLTHETHAFVHEMAALYRRADLAVCRAGASTCAEVLAFGVPALLVPYPFAARNHQLANARALERYGAADVVEEADLESEWLAEYVAGSRANPVRLARMAAAARQRARANAAAALADLVEQCGRG